MLFTLIIFYFVWFKITCAPAMYSANISRTPGSLSALLKHQLPNVQGDVTEIGVGAGVHTQVGERTHKPIFPYFIFPSNSTVIQSQ